MSENGSVVVYGDTVGELAEEDDELSSSFGEEVISLYLCGILRKVRIWICQELNSVWVGFFCFPIGVTTIWQEVS